MGDGGEPTGASSWTGVIGEVRGSDGVEYGLGRANSCQFAGLKGPDWGEVT